MAKSTQTAEAQAEKKAPNKPTLVNLESEVNSADVLAGQASPPGSGAIESQAARLQRLQTAQQQAALRAAGRLHGNQHIQRLATALQQGSTPEPKVKRKAHKPHLVVQTKLTVNEPNDQYEQEADQVAETVMRMPAPATPPPPEDDEKNSVFRFSGPQLQAKSSDIPPIPSDLESRIQGMKGGGQPLPDSERTFFEPRMGVDLSEVRIHTDESAVQTARDLQARAYTVGSDIAFKEGEYAPGTTEGRRLLGHELTHVVQQGAAVPLQRQPEGQETLLEEMSPPETVALQRTPDGIIQLKCTPAPASPEEDPTFQAVTSKVKQTAQQEKTHEPAEQKSAEAQTAAKMPETEKKGQAQAQQAGQVEAAATQQEAAAEAGAAPGFDEEAFVSAVESKINAVMPKDPEEMENIESSGVMDQVEGTVKQKVASGKEAAQGTVDDKMEEPPNEGAVPEKPVKPLEASNPGAPAPQINGASAAPKAKGACEVEEPLQEASQSLDKQMEEAKVTDEMLEKSNEPEFQAALEAKKEAQTSVEEDPKAYRANEQQQIGSAKSEAQAEGEKTGAMHTAKEQAFGQVDGLQEGQKTVDEAKRAEIGQKINAIYEATKTEVTTTLSQIEQDVDAAFSAGSQKAKSDALDYIKRETQAYKDKRYEGAGGTLTQVGDFTGITKLPKEYHDIYNTGRDKFLLQMRQVLKNVAKLVGQGLTKAKQRIEKGRKEIDDYIKSQPKELREIAQREGNKMKGQFDKLEQDVDSKKNEIIDSLADSYNKTLKELEEATAAMKEKDKGLLDKAAEALPGPLGEIAKMLVMLRDVVGDVAEQIIEDPIAFAGMLMSGIQSGLDNFLGKIWTHLKSGFIAWLTGSLTSAGITLPQTWDLKGIFKLVMDVLGLSLSSIGGIIQEKVGFDLMGIIDQVVTAVEVYQTEGMAGLAKYGLAKILGEEKMEGLMKLVDIGQVIMSGDFGKLWEMVQEHLGDLKSMIFDKIQDFLVVEVIKSGVMWIIGLLNPAGAFVKACMAIYKIIMFFIQRGSQIKALVSSVIGALGALASGNIGAIASAIEGALANAIPVAIGFLASLLGIGDISGKIREIINSVRQMVTNAIHKILEFGPIKAVVGFVKTIADKIKAGIQKGKAWAKDKWEKGKAKVKEMMDPGKKKEKPDPEEGEDEESGTDTEKQERLKAAVAEVQQLIKTPGATEESVNQKLPNIQDTHKLKSLTLVREKEDVYHVKATINPILEGPPGVLFTSEELQELEAVAKDFADQINKKDKQKPGWKAKFLADPIGFIGSGKVDKTGDIVEAMGAPEMEKLAAEAGLTVIRNAHIQFIDAAGQKIGGTQAELDFLVLGSSGVQEIVSAKLKPGDHKPKQNKDNLRHFKEMPLTPPDIIPYAQTHFGKAGVYKHIAEARVISNKGTESLSSFRAKYLDKVVVDTITVTSLTPSPEEKEGFQLRVTRPELLAKTVELVKKYI